MMIIVVVVIIQLRALGLLLADDAPTVGWGRLFDASAKMSETRKRKVETSIPRCKMDCLSEGYKGAVNKILGCMAKNGFLGRKPSF